MARTAGRGCGRGRGRAGGHGDDGEEAAPATDEEEVVESQNGEHTPTHEEHDDASLSQSLPQEQAQPVDPQAMYTLMQTLLQHFQAQQPTDEPLAPPAAGGL